MFGIGMPELMIIFVIALLVFGPKELPKIAKTLGKAMSELRRASDELRDGIQREIETATKEEEKEPPPSPPETVPSSPVAEANLPPADVQESVQAEGHGVETATVKGIAGEGEQGGQQVAGATLPAPEGQSQPAATEATSSPVQPAESVQAQATSEQIMKEAGQAGPAESPKEPPPLPRTVPHVPVQTAETRNA